MRVQLLHFFLCAVGINAIIKLPKLRDLMNRLVERKKADYFDKVPRPVTIFKYDIPRALLMGDQLSNYDKCPMTMYATEYILPGILEYRLARPDYDLIYEQPDEYQFDFFLVPHYSVCTFHQCLELGGKWYDCRVKATQYMERILDWVEQNYPFWQRNQGMDHIFIFTWDESMSLFTEKLLRNRLASSIHLTHIGTPYAKKNFDPKKDICIPAMREFKEVEEYPDRFDTDIENPAAKRPIFAYFRGTFKDDKAYGRGVRHVIRKLGETHPHQVFVKDRHSMFYWNELIRARFALCPPGWASWSPRLFDAIVAGAIPVIISDEWVPPFAELVDYSQFTVRIPEDKADKIPEILASIPIEVEALLRQNLKKVHERFVYSFDFYGKTDAFESIYETLIIRKARKDDQIRQIMVGYEHESEVDEAELNEHVIGSDYDESSNRSSRIEL